MELLKEVQTRGGQTLSRVFMRYDFLVLLDEKKIKFACRFYENEESFKNGEQPIMLKNIPSNYICKLTNTAIKKLNSTKTAVLTDLEEKLIVEIEKVAGERTITNL